MPLKQEENPLLTADFFPKVVMRCVTPLEEKPARLALCFQHADLFSAAIPIVGVTATILLTQQMRAYYA